ncbi:putative lipid II flippase FtsW [Clostridium sp. D2Q-14]|uniref:putative lipid II flippase FtsW n=1 Tax=Anaeromonas gelatinilytica TaxID=2683194 RepID=UPI00193C5908|nr:putative lipid II flippase FtsW [Anaeromonas gelatinilytica]MBS4535412.1 putative lipid II flippase FtsW [Anaeromonas gelatinilytica]
MPKKASDFTLMIATIILVFIGIVMVFSSSYPEAYYKLGNPYYYFIKQLIFSGLGLFIMIFFMNFKYWVLRRLSKLIFLGAIILDGLLFTPLGFDAGGATRWINIAGVTIMPSEVIKLASIILMATFLAKKKDDVQKLGKGLLPALFLIALSCGLIIIQPDLSTSATLGVTLVIMLFIAGVKMRHLIGLGAIGAASVVLAIIGKEYRLKRMLIFMDPFANPTGDGWQVVQSLYALGSGGLFGAGLGQSKQKFFYIPEPYSDFIFSIIGEELGFIGGVIVIILFLIIIWRGIKIALSAKDLFSCYLASGITALIAIQTLIHIGVVTSSLPPTGIPLPFVSAGGTSLMVFMAGIGILLNISRHAKLDRS